MMKCGEFLVGMLIALTTIFTFALGLIIGIGSVGKYLKMKSM